MKAGDDFVRRERRLRHCAFIDYHRGFIIVVEARVDDLPYRHRALELSAKNKVSARHHGVGEVGSAYIALGGAQVARVRPTLPFRLRAHASNRHHAHLPVLFRRVHTQRASEVSPARGSRGGVL
ncbi:unnamed protein product [Phytomonas sp. Hart1]|nr:unnamed protein product [Phytomonas sp. Hart1]|eukprot:CCW66811.1 unnamed protein product [Phytomonas sp. isolate Hart1]